MFILRAEQHNIRQAQRYRYVHHGTLLVLRIIICATRASSLRKRSGSCTFNRTVCLTTAPGSLLKVTIRLRERDCCAQEYEYSVTSLVFS